MLADSRLAGMRGALFWLKVSIAAFVVLGSVVSHRFFCKYLCPLGAFYGFFNKISFYRMSCEGRCNDCGTCKKVCKMGVNPSLAPNSPECIRCGDCIEACPCKALKAGWEFGAREAAEE
ncbi:MAG: 4Fe-4S binding protein [Clostridiales bacterium]|nr:4Fe-4S binding protein [Clostridiales bacterium]